MVLQIRKIAVYKADPGLAGSYCCNNCDSVMMQGSELYCERKEFPKRLPSDRKVAWGGSCGYWMNGIPF